VPERLTRLRIERGLQILIKMGKKSTPYEGTLTRRQKKDNAKDEEQKRRKGMLLQVSLDTEKEEEDGS